MVKKRYVSGGYIDQLIHRPNCMINFGNKPLTEEGAKKTIESLDKFDKECDYQFTFQANIQFYKEHIGFFTDTKEGADLYIEWADELIQNNFRKDDVFGILETIVSEGNTELNDIKADNFKQKVAEYLVSQEREAGKEYIERNK